MAATDAIILAVDAGGTSTRAVAVRADGADLASVLGEIEKYRARIRHL